MTRRAPTRRDTPDAGFTLLEMIVVLVIIGLAATIVGARTGRVTPQVELRASVQKLAAELRIARAEALRTGGARTVTIDPMKRAYWGGAVKSVTSLPSAVLVRAAPANLSTAPDAPREGTDPLHIVFSPDGSSSGGAVALASGKARATITVDWLTGATHVAWER